MGHGAGQGMIVEPSLSTSCQMFGPPRDTVSERTERSVEPPQLRQVLDVDAARRLDDPAGDAATIWLRVDADLDTRAKITRIARWLRLEGTPRPQHGMWVLETGRFVLTAEFSRGDPSTATAQLVLRPSNREESPRPHTGGIEVQHPPDGAKVASVLKAHLEDVGLIQNDWLVRARLRRPSTWVVHVTPMLDGVAYLNAHVPFELTLTKDLAFDWIKIGLVRWIPALVLPRISPQRALSDGEAGEGLFGTIETGPDPWKPVELTVQYTPTFSTGGHVLAWPTYQWAERAPDDGRSIRRKLRLSAVAASSAHVERAVNGLLIDRYT
jgi:hypothetical protein